MKKNNLFERTYTFKRVSSYIGTIQNTPARMSRFREFRRTIREQAGKLIYLQGRNPNRKALAIKHGVSHNQLRQNVPVKWATSFDVYWR